MAAALVALVASAVALALEAAPELEAAAVVIAPTIVAIAVEDNCVPLGRQIPPWSMSLLSKAPTSPGRQQKYASRSQDSKRTHEGSAQEGAATRAEEQSAAVFRCKLVEYNDVILSN